MRQREEIKGMPRTRALVVSDGGAGALLRAAAAMGCAPLVRALLDAGLTPFEADSRCTTATHAAAAGGHAGVCALLLKDTRLVDLHRKDVDGRTAPVPLDQPDGAGGAALELEIVIPESSCGWISRFSC